MTYNVTFPHLGLEFNINRWLFPSGASMCIGMASSLRQGSCWH